MTVGKQLVTALGVAAALAVSAIGARAVGIAAGVRTVTMDDQCDPETFNAAFGPGTCVNQGGVQLDTFIAELAKTRKAGLLSMISSPA